VLQLCRLSCRAVERKEIAKLSALKLKEKVRSQNFMLDVKGTASTT
jgi:hypothetical protein